MKIIKRILVGIIVIVGILIINTKVNAANASIKCDSSATEGTPIKITVSGTGVQWNLALKVDGTTIASNSELENYESNKSISFSGTYTPTSTGNKKITLEGTVTEFSDGSTIRSFASKEIKVNPKKSNNGSSTTTTKPSTSQAKATITKLVVAGKTYKNPGKTTTVKVDNNVTNAKISVTTSNGESYSIDKGSSVKLEEGTNTVKITLASGNVYTVNIRRAAKEDDKPNIIDETKEVKVLLKNLLIKGVRAEGEDKVSFILSPEFSPEVYEYTLTIPEDKSDITKLDIQADPSEKDYTVEIKGNEDLEAGENIITIIVKSKNGEKTATYTIKVNKEQTTVQVASNVEEIPQEVEEVKENETAKWIIVIFTALVAIAGIIFAVIEYQYGKTHGTDPKGEIPFANIGFETGKDTKSSILGNIKEDMIQTIDDEKINKKGKHF